MHVYNLLYSLISTNFYFANTADIYNFIGNALATVSMPNDTVTTADGTQTSTQLSDQEKALKIVAKQNYYLTWYLGFFNKLKLTATKKLPMTLNIYGRGSEVIVTLNGSVFYKNPLISEDFNTYYTTKYSRLMKVTITDTNLSYMLTKIS